MQKHLFSLLYFSIIEQCARSLCKRRIRKEAEAANYNSIVPWEDYIACFTSIELRSRFPCGPCYRVASLKDYEAQEQMLQIDGLLNDPLGF